MGFILFGFITNEALITAQNTKYNSLKYFLNFL